MITLNVTALTRLTYAAAPAWGLTNTVFEAFDLSHALSLTSGAPLVADQPFSTSGGALELSSISALRARQRIAESVLCRR
jgi:hypothetical protein